MIDHHSLPTPDPLWYPPESKATRPHGWYYERESGWSYGPFAWEYQAEEFQTQYKAQIEANPDTLTPEKVKELLDLGAKQADSFAKRVHKW